MPISMPPSAGFMNNPSKNIMNGPPSLYGPPVNYAYPYPNKPQYPPNFPELQPPFPDYSSRP